MIDWSGKFVSVHESELREHEGFSNWLPSFGELNVYLSYVKVIASASSAADEIAMKHGYRLHHSFWTPAGFVFVFGSGDLRHDEV